MSLYKKASFPASQHYRSERPTLWAKSKHRKQENPVNPINIARMRLNLV